MHDAIEAVKDSFLHVGCNYFLYHLTPASRPEKLWAKKPVYRGGQLAGGLITAQEAEQQLAAMGAAVMPPWDSFDIPLQKSRLTAGYCLGYYFEESAKRFFYDLDGCRNPVTGELTPIAQEAVGFFEPCGAYIEVSPSGTGLHIVGSYTGERPHHSVKNDELDLEFYTADRGMAIGTPYAGTGSMVADCTAILNLMVALYFQPRVESAPATGPVEELTAAQKEIGVATFLKRCKGYPQQFTGGWNTELTAFAYSTGRKVAAGVFTEEWAREKMLEVEWVATYCEEEPHTVESNMSRGFMDSAGSPWDGAEVEGYFLDQAGFGNGALPPGASLEPVAGVVRVGAPAKGQLAPGYIAELAEIVATHPDKAEQMEHMTQIGTQESIASGFAMLYADKLRFDHSRKKWYVWDGTRWVFDGKNQVFELVVNLCRKKNHEGKSSIGSSSFAQGVEKIASSKSSMAVAGDEWDRDNYLLNTPAGTVDLRTGEVRPHAPADMITKITRESATGDGATFSKFLREITDGDDELAQFHQISLGACLSGAVEGHWMLFWTGVGRNGKNTLGDLVQDVMGEYAKKIPSSTLTSKKFQGHPEEIAFLHGSRLAISSEINDGEHWDEARINEVTGDATLTARHMHGSSFTFRRTHKHLVYANYKPQLRSVSDGIRSRLKIVPFKVSFMGREDVGLPGRLRSDMGYVLQWLIEGHRKWQATGKKLPRCAAVDAECSEYFESQSTPQLWLKENVEVLNVDPRPLKDLPTVRDLYRNYKDWKVARGEQPVSQTRWTDAALKGFEKVRSNAAIKVRGIRLLSLFPPPATAMEGFISGPSIN